MNGLFGQYNSGFNPFGDLGFQPMSMENLGLLGISNPNVMSFRTPSYDKPIQPFGMGEMPVYGYNQQFPPEVAPEAQPEVGGPGPTPFEDRQQLANLGALTNLNWGNSENPNYVPTGLVPGMIQNAFQVEDSGGSPSSQLKMRRAYNQAMRLANGNLNSFDRAQGYT